MGIIINDSFFSIGGNLFDSMVGMLRTIEDKLISFIKSLYLAHRPLNREVYFVQCNISFVVVASGIYLIKK